MTLKLILITNQKVVNKMEIEYKEIFNDGNNKLYFSFDVEVSDYYYYYIYFENNDFKAKIGASYYKLDLESFIKNVDSNLNANDTINLFETDSDGYISFKKLDNLGHFELKGILGGSHDNFSLRFTIDVDQTTLIILANYFKKNL